MADWTQQEKAAPEFSVRIGGRDLPQETATDIKTISIEEDVDTPGMFAFEMLNWDVAKLKMKWSDQEDFSEGKEVEILIGYRDNREKVISGEITGLELKINGRETPKFEVRGYDRRHRLMRGRKSRSYMQIKDSDIASKIASEAGLSPQTEDTGVTLDYILQHNQTDLEFLLERARRIGYEVACEDSKLYFRKRRHTETEVLTLNRQLHLMEFYPRLTTMNQASQYEVRGWDVKQKSAITASSSEGSEVTKMGGSRSGPSIVKQAFGAKIVTSIDRPISTQAEADQIAKGRFNDMALTFISGYGVAIGHSKLRAGIVVKMEDLGDRFSGLYYVTSTKHTYSPGRGYRTAFTVRRNAT